MRLFPFDNSYSDHDFTLLIDTIAVYFPVNGSERLTAQTITSWPGFRKSEKIVQAEFFVKKAYRAKWGRLISHLKKVLGKKTSGYPDLTSGAFFGEIIISKAESADFIRQKSLRFYISTKGPFFSIHGHDSSVAILQTEPDKERFNKNYFEATHAITVSPVFEYEEMFTLLEDELRKYFPGYLFVPYDIGMSTMKNISVADDMDDPGITDTIYEAIFGRKALHSCMTRGDENYGMNDWLKPLDEDEESLLDLISQHILRAPKEATIHRVWKFESSRRLDSFHASGPLTFGIGLFTVMDLTDKSDLIVIAEKRGAPARGRYTVRDGVIEMGDNDSILFRIVEISEDTLTLNLILNFVGDIASIAGEVLEMKFIPLKKLP